MNNIIKIILGIFITILVMMLSGGFEAEISSLFSFIPLGLTSQVVIFILSSILIYFFNKKGIISGFLFGLIHFGLITTGASIDFVLQTVSLATIIGLIAGIFKKNMIIFHLPLLYI